MTKKQRKVVIVRSTAVAPCPRVISAADALQSAGFEIAIIAWDRYGFNNNEFSDSYLTYRHISSNEHGRGMLNLVGLLRYQFYILFKLCRLSADVVHAFDLDTAFPAWLYCVAFRKKFVYDVADFFATSRYMSPLASVLAEKLEHFIAKRADLLILVDEGRICQFEKVLPQLKNELIIIHNTPPRLKNFAVLETSCDVAYVGILQADRKIVEFCEAARAFPNLKIIIAGFGILQEQITLLADKYANITFLGKISHEQALIVQNSARYILALYDSTLMDNKLASPNKKFEALMLGKPVITSKKTLFATFVSAENAGLVIDDQDPDAFNKALTIVADKTITFDGDRLKRIFEENFSPEQEAAKLVAAYKKLN